MVFLPPDAEACVCLLEDLLDRDLLRPFYDFAMQNAFGYFFEECRVLLIIL